MSWFISTNLLFFEWFCINILKCGPIPRHIAFIMDGNRRYSKNLKIKQIDGHKKGYERMIQIIDWCFKLDITEVTVFAFSIENFKRAEHEVKELLDFSKKMFQRFIDEKDPEICVRVLGNLPLLSDDMQKLIADVVLSTQNNTKKTLNICFSYTSRDEITDALQELNFCVRNNIINESDINESLISRFLYTTKSIDPDIIVRTSGEVRLSDFLLYQSSYSVLIFAKSLWPEITIWGLFAAIFYYQRNCDSVKSLKLLHQKRRQKIEDKLLYKTFKKSGQKDLEAFRRNTDQRIEKCLLYLENKRLNQLKEMLKREIDSTINQNKE